MRNLPMDMKIKEGPLRILHIANEADNVGNGIANVMVDLACAQSKAGHTVCVVAGTDGFAPLLRKNNVEFVLLDQRRNPFTIIKAALSFRRLIRDFAPQVIHAHMMTGALLSRVARIGTGVGVVTTVHNEWQRSAVIMGVGDRVIAVSQAVAANMVKRGIRRSKIRVVCNGPLGSARKQGERPQSFANLLRPAILTVAGLYERKGLHELIRSFDLIAKQFPSTHLYVVGEGPDAHLFKSLASQLPSRDRIHFEGFQPNPEDYMRAADIFVLASRQEPSGLVLAEAREASAAIVATRVDGIPETLDDGAAGILVPPRDVTALARALTMLLESPAVLEEWRARSRQGLERLSVDRLSNETLTVYRELAQP
jgi:glycosyltransferase involved in cell wall biosynthesis